MAVAIGVPLWLVLITATKTTGDALDPSLSLPEHGRHVVENLREVVTDGRVLAALAGSALTGIPSVFLVLLFGAIASWTFARRAGRWLAIGYAVVTVVLLLRQLAIAGTVPGMIGVYTGIHLATGIFLITGFIRTAPIELEEAARVDTLPLNLFTVASAGLYLNNWNLIFAYVILMNIPLLVTFVIAQRRIISGITGGAVE